MQRIAVLLTLVILLLMASRVLAMSSDHYRMDWYVLLSGSGGALESTHYHVGLTVGQVATGKASSTNFATGLGYWFGLLREWLAHLPIVLKGFPR
jgi:uncharacterized membrane protein